jgi:hypothetical protein
MLCPHKSDSRLPGAFGKPDPSCCEFGLLYLGCVSKITKAHYRRLDLHILVEKPRRSTTAPAFFVSICKPIQQNCIFQTLETHPSRVRFKNHESVFPPPRHAYFR